MVDSLDDDQKPVYQVHPLRDPRWAELVDRHPHSSVFHTVSWLRALNRTYGYHLLAFTTSPPGVRLENALVFCRVTSWITGRRLISLPFSDHCDPLLSTSDEHLFIAALEQSLHQEELSYVEIRPKQPFTGPTSFFHSAQSYCFHQIDLRPDLATLYSKFHTSSTQRKIRRAERESLVCEVGRSQVLLDSFWKLLLITRRRQQVPPQPKNWFHNLIDCFGNALQIRVAFKDQQPVASLLTIRHKDTLVYKYGCSDNRFHNLGGTHLLFWRAIQDAKRDGLRVFDLGRSDCDNPGLITFKDRWGSDRSMLTYSRFSVAPPPGTLGLSFRESAGRIARGMVPYLPDRILQLVGSALYRHIA